MAIVVREPPGCQTSVLDVTEIQVISMAITVH
jgi:hypothetical protein